MSAHADQTAKSVDTDRQSADTAQYSPYNWIEDDEAETEAEDGTHGDSSSGHSETTGTTKESSLTRLVLKQTSDRIIDPIALHEPPEEGLHDFEGQVIDLTDEEVFPPTRRYRHTPQTQMQKKAPATEPWRYSEVGHVTFGGIIPDRSKSELLEAIDLFFALVQTRLTSRTKAKIRDRAMTLKSSGDIHDTEIMRRVGRWTFNPTELELAATVEE
ncbi:hypothetical protein [Natronorubrum daqingense]|uniref:Uncharacterized protein n=1 Tax=Natronorubrum daqingense TaxID=588898 RepID=A0A1N7FY28_9EURY|nr:hypothetical protein [Natronorubrum daqingense]APX98553.1 hypothetical protein BB347_17770 [Natronorubrum daqingense]SIS05221.1 hypothetical protein SAMN05421809_3560 [Natronorubrum daqingense]